MNSDNHIEKMLTKLDTTIFPSPVREGPVGIEAFSGFFSGRVVFFMPPTGMGAAAAERRDARARPRPPVVLRRSLRIWSRDWESLSGMVAVILVDGWMECECCDEAGYTKMVDSRVAGGLNILPIKLKGAVLQG